MKRSHWIVIPAIAALLTTMTACNEKAEPEKSEADSQAQAEVKEPVITQTSAAPKTKEDFEKILLGTWELDSEIFKTAIEAGMAEAQTEIDPEDPMAAMMAEMMNEMMTMMMDMKMSIEFSADGNATMSTTAMGEESSEEGEWEITEVDGTMLTIVIDGDPNIVNYISNDIIEMVLSEEEAAEAPPGMEKMIMNRVK